ncbi:hypothetical protein GIX45_01185 [Erwinia sp. CPCC 100877]|nr:hypothetical protein [Erwinia sp. CPCC 100877]
MNKMCFCLFITLMAGTALKCNVAHARNSMGQLYTPVSTVSLSKSQVVYYRSDSLNFPGAADVYVDGEFQTALLPGGYNVFCVMPGKHSLSSFIKDYPGYAGKKEHLWPVELNAGQTYFFRVTNDNTGKPEMVDRALAEKELGSMHQQIHVLPRASAVVDCQDPTTE